MEKQPVNSRRDFVKKAILSSAALTVGGVLPGFTARSYKSILGANEKFNVGVMGVNSRGLALASNFAKQPNCLVRYISDVDQRAADKCITRLETIQHFKPVAQPDFRKALEKKDLDVLVVAAPDHWHAPAALLAMQAGKHVYLEKPCSHNPREGELLVAAQKKYGKVLQMGNQRRSWPNVAQAIKEIHEGVIGKPYFAKTWYTNSRKPIGTGKVTAVPTWLNYDLWQGPAPRKPYKDNLIHYNWHWFWHWGTGEALNNGTHMVDLARWGLQVDYPTKVQSSGGTFAFSDDWETPDTQMISLEFADKSMITWEGRSANGKYNEGASVGVIFYGEKGSLQINGGNSYSIYGLDNKLQKEVKDTTEFKAGDLSNPTEKLDGFHFQNLFDAIKGNATLHSDIQEGYKSTLLVQLGNIAQRTSGMLVTDPANGHIRSDAAAMKLWGRSYEKGWEPHI
ncbi:Gfo/Idh/MocA family protein [Niabella beijingensis]|uniref:Gfo/Idh/MocA family protein n=1 Tax=Niabella beijingensis TaxID=2872700 RepID=UPI001CC19A0D|nr:Gfo/Idh/MocA family oxidoreductase [Niabella beijingensis]MBZ4188616.1 Gfo/Idh/MocA family oxidoreductase [Niabella beijingensis]